MEKKENQQSWSDRNNQPLICDSNQHWELIVKEKSFCIYLSVQNSANMSR